MIVAFVIATKHHLRAEGGVHHDDLKGELRSRDRFPTSERLTIRLIATPFGRVKLETFTPFIVE